MYKLQRLFSKFPDGLPGVGLLLLRVTLALSIIIPVGEFLIHHDNLPIKMWLISLLIICSGTALLLGLLTPIAVLSASLIGASFCFSIVTPPDLNLFDSKLATLYFEVIAIAIFMLGPGGFSLDARWFGRREIVIPSIPPS